MSNPEDLTEKEIEVLKEIEDKTKNSDDNRASRDKWIDPTG